VYWQRGFSITKKRWVVVSIIPVSLLVLAGCSPAGAPNPYGRHPAMGPSMTQEMMGRGMMGRVADDPAKTSDDSSPVPTLTVGIRDFAFTPARIQVATGATVTWTNEDIVPHTVRGEIGSEMASHLLGKGDKFSYTFPVSGTYSYYCAPHPWMTGEVIVG